MREGADHGKSQNLEIYAENMSFKLKLFGKQDRKCRWYFRYHSVGWESWKAFEQGKEARLLLCFGETSLTARLKVWAHSESERGDQIGDHSGYSGEWT